MKTIEDRATECVRAIASWDRYLEGQGRARDPGKKDQDDADFIVAAIRLAITAERRAVKRREVQRG